MVQQTNDTSEAMIHLGKGKDSKEKEHWGHQQAIGSPCPPWVEGVLKLGKDRSSHGTRR